MFGLICVKDGTSFEIGGYSTHLTVRMWTHVLVDWVQTFLYALRLLLSVVLVYFEYCLSCYVLWTLVVSSVYLFPVLRDTIK